MPGSQRVARTDAERLRPMSSAQPSQVNEPDQGEEAKALFDRQSEVGPRLLGAGETGSGTGKSITSIESMPRALGARLSLRSAGADDHDAR